MRDVEEGKGSLCDFAAEKVEKRSTGYLGDRGRGQHHPRPWDAVHWIATLHPPVVILWSGEKKKQGKNVAEMSAKYIELKEQNTDPKKYKKWTNAEEVELKKSMKEEISVDETELGRQRAELKEQKAEELTVFAKGNPEEAAQILVLMLMDNSNTDLELDKTVVPTQPWL